MSNQQVAAQLRRTPLHNLHVDLGAKMVPFAGYEMPVQYPMGVLREHLHTRSQAGLFDVSHMGQVRIRGAERAAELERLVPIDIIDLQPGRQRYGFFTEGSGGLLDDLMIANLGDELFVVVNAACKGQDYAWMLEKMNVCRIEALDDLALLAIQGPEAASVMARFAPELATLPFMSIGAYSIAGIPCTVSRSGYTGEDGYEISVPADSAERLARELLTHPEVAPIGLGARDSLRLEAGLCLYGHDMDRSTSPVEASLTWAISKVRRPGGTRAGGYVGDRVITAQLQNGVSRKRVGLLPAQKVPVREGAKLTDSTGREIGKVTSGTFGPTFQAPVAMGYLDSAAIRANKKVFADVRGQLVEVTIAPTPFVLQRYYRG